jgi:hypothetical protein
MPRHYFPFLRAGLLSIGCAINHLGRKEALGDSSKDVRAKADLRFRKAERAATARDQAMNEYAAESERRRLKTAKLKELRLAKEAEEQAAAAAVPPAPKKKPVVKLAKPAVKLSKPAKPRKALKAAKK